MTELEQHIKTLFGIQQQHLKRMAGLFVPALLDKDAYFIRSGQYGVSLSFVKQGFLRVFEYKDVKDITQWIFTPGEFVTDLSSLVFDTPARWNVQALTDCELYSLSRGDYQKIDTIVPQWKDLEKLFIAKCFLNLEDRVFSFLSMTAEERFLHLLEQNPDLFNQVPLHFIASMLGMTPETLSRIRRKLIS